jgi:hypothetical protein
MSMDEERELFGGAVKMRRTGSLIEWEGPKSAEEVARLRREAHERADRAEAEVTKIAEELRNLLTSYDFVPLVTQLTMAMTSGRPDEDDAADKFGSEAKLEYLGGIALSLPARGTREPPATVIQRARDLVEAVFRCEQVSLMRPPNETLPQVVATAQWQLRLTTLMDRMQGYATHLEQLIEAVYADLREPCFNHLGFNPADLPRLVRACHGLIQQRFWQALETVSGRSSGPQVDSYAAAQRTLAVLAAASEDLLVFEPTELADQTGLPETELQAMLEALSTEVGCQRDYRRPIDDNRLWRYPVVTLGDGRFFFSYVWTPLHEAVPWFLDLARTRNLGDLERRFLSARDRVAESLTKSELAAVFGLERVHGPLFYELDGAEYEIDALVDLGAADIVVEAKAHRVTDPVRRGAPARIERLAKDVVAKPLEQTRRAREYILGGGRRFRDSTGRIVELSGHPREVQRMAVWFEKVDPLALLSGFSAEEAMPDAWVVCLTDLMMVREILDDPASLYAYIAARAGVSKGGVALAFMESDLLGGFLTDRLRRLADLADGHPDAERIVGFHSAALNSYFTSRDMGYTPDRPVHGVPNLVVEGLRAALRDLDASWPDAARTVMAQRPEAWRGFGKVLRKVRSAGRNSRRPISRRFSCSQSLEVELRASRDKDCLHDLGCHEERGADFTLVIAEVQKREQRPIRARGFSR